jgi:membrane protein DedA with SNARE-associated domain
MAETVRAPAPCQQPSGARWPSLVGPVSQAAVLHELVRFWFSFVHDWGYAGVTLLMAMESSIFPVPSEIVIPPAAFWAAQGKMSFWGVVLAGTFGSWLGATATYWAARWLGRAVVARWGRLIACGPEKVERAERMLGRYALGGVFFSRLLPVVRHVIGIPAGILRLDFRLYSIATLVGSFIWCTVLAWYGARMAREHPTMIDDPQLFMDTVKSEALWIVLACALLCALYLLMLRLTARRSEPSA